MKNKLKNNKIFAIGLSILAIVLIVIGVTYSWFVWSSSNTNVGNTNVTMSIDESVVVSFSGGSQISGTLSPVYSYTDGLSSTFTLTNNNTTTTKSVIYSVYLDITTLPTELKSTAFKYVLSQSSTILSEGNFSSYNSGNTINVYSSTLPSGSTTLKLTIYIDGNIENNSNMINKTFTGSIRVETTPLDSKASSYVTYLYTSAEKTTATVNSVTYNQAPIFDNDDDANSSGGLMNDRRDDSNGGNTATDPDGGNIRYYGANPNNYVWMGDTYTSTYTYTSNKVSVTRNVGDKKLWRIIGVFDGRLKLIQADPIGESSGSNIYGLSWDTSENATGYNRGSGINQWGPSPANGSGYEGADLMRLLNQDSNGNNYTGTNGSLYWNKGTGTVYTGSNNGTTSNVSFANTGLSADEKNMIDTATWYLGATNGDAPYVDVQYKNERQSSILGKYNCSGTSCNDSVTRLATWEGKVGLMYASDYGYAADLKNCNLTLYNYSNSTNSYACRANDWLFDSSKTQWTISPWVYSDFANNVALVSTNGQLVYNIAAGKYLHVRPAIYLKPSVIIDTEGKDGSESNPYVLSLG